MGIAPSTVPTRPGPFSGTWLKSSGVREGDGPQVPWLLSGGGGGENLRAALSHGLGYSLSGRRLD